MLLSQILWWYDKLVLHKDMQPSLFPVAGDTDEDHCILLLHLAHIHSMYRAMVLHSPLELVHSLLTRLESSYHSLPVLLLVPFRLLRVPPSQESVHDIPLVLSLLLLPSLQLLKRV